MSNMVRSDEIDELVSLVRNLVSSKEPDTLKKTASYDRLILTPAQRIDEPVAVEPASDTTHEAEPEQVMVLTDRVLPERTKLEAEPEQVMVLADGVMPARTKHEVTFAEPVVPVTAGAQESETNCNETLNNAAMATGAFAPTQDQSGADAADLTPRKSRDINEQLLATDLDEVAFREAVVRIIREELAGDLGVTITRNIRKLVRREIDRVLLPSDPD